MSANEEAAVDAAYEILKHDEQDHIGDGPLPLHMTVWGIRTPEGGVVFNESHGLGLLLFSTEDKAKRYTEHSLAMADARSAGVAFTYSSAKLGAILLAACRVGCRDFTLDYYGYGPISDHVETMLELLA